MANDVPAQAATYHESISRIYAARGNQRESERFREFAGRARTEQGDPLRPGESRHHA